MTEQQTPQRGATSVLWFMLAAIALVRLSVALGWDVPFLERTAFWRVQRHPGASALIAAFILAVIAVHRLVRRLPRHGTLAVRLLAWVLGGAGVACWFFFDPVMGGSFMAAAGAMGRSARPRPPPTLAPRGKGAGQQAINPWTLLIPLVAGVLLTLGVSRWVYGEAVPPAPPERQVLGAYRQRSVAVLQTLPLGQPPETLTLAPGLPPQELLRRFREEEGWMTGEVLKRLSAEVPLARLPVMEAQQASSLLEPLLASGTALPQGARTRGFWGVAVEAERPSGKRLLFFSLSPGAPSAEGVPVQHLLFESSGPQGAWRLVTQEQAFPAPEGPSIEWPGLLILCVFGSLALYALGLAVLHALRAPRASHP